MKKNIFFLFFLLAQNSFSQNEVKTSSGMISFEASVPLFEPIFATNKSISCKLNLKTGTISSEVPMKQFRFKLSLMEAHFNEKYLETERYPTANFTGRIEGFNYYIVGTTPKEFKMKGEMKIHGKTQKIQTKVFIKKTTEGLEINSNFDLNSKDFDIEIPELLSMKISKKVKVTVVYTLK